MQFGMVNVVSRGMGVLYGDGDRRRGKAVLGVNLGHTIVINGCADVVNQLCCRLGW